MNKADVFGSRSVKSASKAKKREHSMQLGVESSKKSLSRQRSLVSGPKAKTKATSSQPGIAKFIYKLNRLTYEKYHANCTCFSPV